MSGSDAAQKYQKLWEVLPSNGCAEIAQHHLDKQPVVQGCHAHLAFTPKQKLLDALQRSFRSMYLVIVAFKQDVLRSLQRLTGLSIADAP